MEAVRTRRWYQLHWLTCLAIVVELAAIAYVQSVGQNGNGMDALDSSGRRYFVNFGWPARHLWRFEIYTPIGSYTYSPPRFEYAWKARPLLFNCFILALLTSSVGWLVETWLRRRSRLQFSLRAVCELFAVVAVMLTLVKQRTIVEGSILLMGLVPGRPFQPWFDAPYELNAWAWPAVVVIFFGVSCSVWLLIHLAPQATYRLLKCMNPARA
jgi:hypothetical protein